MKFGSCDFCLSGLETLEEFEAYKEIIRNGISSGLFRSNSDFWLGGKYNSNAGKYQWVGSGVNADIREMYFFYPPAANHNFRLFYSKHPQTSKIIYASRSVWFQAGFCEEYPSSSKRALNTTSTTIVMPKVIPTTTETLTPNTTETTPPTTTTETTTLTTTETTTETTTLTYY